MRLGDGLAVSGASFKKLGIPSTGRGLDLSEWIWNEMTFFVGWWCLGTSCHVAADLSAGGCGERDAGELNRQAGPFALVMITA